MVEGSGCSVCTLLSLKLGKQDMHSHRCLETKHHQISITPVPLAMQTQISTHLCEAFCNSYVHMNRYESIWNRLPVTGYPWIRESDESSGIAGGSTKLRKHEWRIVLAQRFAEPKVVTATLHPIRRKVAVYVTIILHMGRCSMYYCRKLQMLYSYIGVAILKPCS